MRAIKTLAFAATIAAACSATSAWAGQIHIQSDIAQGHGSGFGFSVLHAPQNGQGNGHILYRYRGSFETVYDDVAQTIAFTRFDADLFSEHNLNPSTSGGPVGSLSLVSGGLTKQATGDLVSGSLILHLILDGVGEGDVTLLFQQNGYNPLANRFDADSFRLGLWGATADMFGQGPTTQIGDTGLTSLGMDLLSTNSMQMVPLPSGVALGSAGLLGMFGARRRRRGV